MKLLENTISAVRSRVEVAKAERDRNFQDAIAILGVGWSVASFVPSLDKLGDNANDPVRVFLSYSPLPPTWVKPAVPLVYKHQYRTCSSSISLAVDSLMARISETNPITT